MNVMITLLLDNQNFSYSIIFSYFFYVNYANLLHQVEQLDTQNSSEMCQSATRYLRNFFIHSCELPTHQHLH